MHWKDYKDNKFIPQLDVQSTIGKQMVSILVQGFDTLIQILTIVYFQ